MTRLVGLLLTCIVLITSSTPASEAPDFSAIDRSGREISLSQFLAENNLVLVYYWMAGCTPSTKLLPFVQAFQDTYADEGLSCVVVYSWFRCTAELGEQYLERHEYTIPVIEDRSGRLQELFSVRAFPHTVILDSEGRILLDECGYSCGDEIAIQELLHSELTGNPLPADRIISLSEMSESGSE